MATVTQVIRTCDVCGNAKDVQAWTFGLDGKAYEIDLCLKDGKDLGKIKAGYVSKARKVTSRQSHSRKSHRPRSHTATAVNHSRPRKAKAASKRAVKATGGPKKGIYVYGILPADIEVAADLPGVGKDPGLLRVVRSDGLAALISEVDLSGRLGSPDDLRTSREILDATATELPVLPLRFGTVLASEDAVAEELLATHHDEFADVLEQLEGCAEFLVKGRYVDQTVSGSREEDMRALGQALDGISVASVVREPDQEPDAIHVAFLVPVAEESDAERAIDDLAGDWEGRIEVQLLGPMAAYDFVETAKPEG